MRPAIRMLLILGAASLLAVLLSFCSCAHGRTIEQAELERVVINETTEENLIEWFGKPQARQNGADGNMKLIYTGSFSGPFMVGFRARSIVFSVRKGVVVHWALSEIEN